MLEKSIVAIESVLSTLMRVLKFHINDYCDLETTYDNFLVAKDGSLASVLRYDGFRSLVGKREYEDYITQLTHFLQTFLDTRGHHIQFVFERDEDPTEELDRIFEPAYDTLDRLDLSLSDLLDEKKQVHKDTCMMESVYIVIWTRPAILDPAEVKISAEETQALANKYKLPGLKKAQNFLRPNRFMVDRHRSFVDQFISEVTNRGGAIAETKVAEAFRDMKRYLYRDTTPSSWRPCLLGDPMWVRWKNDKNLRDLSELSYPRLDDQYFSSRAVNGNPKGAGGVTDERAVRIGNYLYSPVMIKIPPQRVQPFSQLFANLNRAKTSTQHDKPIPWSISFMIEGDGLNGLTLRKVFAGILGLSSLSNRNLLAAANSLQKYKESGDPVVKLQVGAMTWVRNDPSDRKGAEKELTMRRRKLANILSSWGNCTVEEEREDPLEAVTSCVPGLRLDSILNASAPPLLEAMYMLPLGRPTSPFNRAQTVYRTLDGKLLSWEIFSAQQTTWITLLVGGPGSGKSVESNRRNTDMCLMPGITRLPYLGIIDIGVSSSGFIDLIRDGLPDEKKHQAVYLRVQNTHAYSINQFDTQLGCRKPLPRERESMKSFLLQLVTPPARGRPHNFMSEFVGQVIDRAFHLLSDENPRGNPKEFQDNINPDLTKKIHEAGISYRDGTKWWEIVDALFKKGYYYEASVAQRYAVPTFFDMVAAGADQSIITNFEEAEDGGMNVAAEFKLMMSTAASDYPIFTGETVLDVRDARVMAIDLQDVVSGDSAAAKKQAALMYMMASNAFLRKINICKEELDSVNPMYKEFHAARVQELSEEFKRLFIDEYHKTGNSQNFQDAILVYGRESRKWGLEIVLSSQLPTDFKELSKLATVTLIMQKGTPDTRREIREIFSLNDTAEQALLNFVNGPQAGIGTTYLAIIQANDRNFTQLFTSTCGGQELWALATTMEDRGLRNLLYEQMPKHEARRILRKRFPNGTCKSYVAAQKVVARSDVSEGYVDEEVDLSIIQKLAAEMIQEWRVARSTQ